MSNCLEINNHLIDLTQINWIKLGKNFLYISFRGRDNVEIGFATFEEASKAYKLLKEKLNA